MDAATLKQAKKYADKLVQGLGSIKGANCTIKSTTKKDDGTELVFEWVGNNGLKETTSIFIKNGEQGNGITKVEKIKTVHLVHLEIKDVKQMLFSIIEKAQSILIMNIHVALEVQYQLKRIVMPQFQKELLV